METLVELEKFIDMCLLPKGMRFHEWMPGSPLAGSGSDLVTPPVDSGLLMAIEREKDHKVADFEIANLAVPRGSPRVYYCFRLAALAKAVDKAIAELET